MDWRHRAACRGYDPEIWFPTAAEGASVFEAQVAEAKSVCAMCPVRFECLTWALESGQDYGVWGGLTEGERRALRRFRPGVKIGA